jgi:hypothetical protein
MNKHSQLPKKRLHSQACHSPRTVNSEESVQNDSMMQLAQVVPTWEQYRSASVPSNHPVNKQTANISAPSPNSAQPHTYEGANPRKAVGLEPTLDRPQDNTSELIVAYWIQSFRHSKTSPQNGAAQKLSQHRPPPSQIMNAHCVLSQKTIAVK